MRALEELDINEGGARVLRASPTPEEIQALESNFGVKLPAAYLALLRHSNGGHPRLDSFIPSAAQEQVFWSVNRFYHLSENRSDAEGVWNATAIWRRATGIALVSIANTGAGHQIVLDYREQPPSVEICLHDEGYRFLRAANTFEAFLDLLCEDPDMI